MLALMRGNGYDAPTLFTDRRCIIQFLDAAMAVIEEEDREAVGNAPVHALMADGSSDRHHAEQETTALRVRTQAEYTCYIE